MSTALLIRSLASNDEPVDKAGTWGRAADEVNIESNFSRPRRRNAADLGNKGQDISRGARIICLPPQGVKASENRRSGEGARHRLRRLLGTLECQWEILLPSAMLSSEGRRS